MSRPAWLAIGAAAGAIGISVMPPFLVVAAGCALLSLGMVAIATRRTGVAARLLPVAVGVVAIALRVAVTPASPVAQAEPPTGDGPWIGVVQSVGAPRQGARPALVRLTDGAPILIAATLPWYPAIVPFDRVVISGRIRAPPEGEYGDYLAKIGAIGTLRSETIEVLPAEGGLEGVLEGLRRSAAEGLDRAIPEPEAGLAAGVLIGLRDRVDRDLAADFTTAGASHVVAISGWNIAIVASALAAIAGGFSRRRRAVLTALAIVAYVAFVGPSASVVRAGVMAGVALLARELGRPGTAAAALGWAVTGLLLLDPAWAFDAGFRLSVLATAGIIAWGSQLAARLAGGDPSRLRRWVAEILGVSFAAQAATTPIVLMDFGRLSLVAPAVNLIVVPLVPPAMGAGALALVVGVLVGVGLPAVVAVIVGLPAWVLYAAMVAVVRAGAGLPLASLELGPPWDTVSAVVSLALIIGAARWGDTILASVRRALRPGVQPAGAAGRTVSRRPRAPRARVPRMTALALATATVGLALAVAYRPSGIARVTVLDVGQGDGILVESGRGGRMVVDGGPDPGRLLIALDERLPPWDRRIDILVLTHPHEDHVAGLATLLERYRVGRVYEPGMLGPGPGYRAWDTLLAKGGPPHGRLGTGDRLTLDEIGFRVLWPDPGRVPERPADSGTGINNVSIVLLGEVGPYRFLLAGDIEEGVDPELIERGLPTVDLLKVAHHGSRTATTTAFLEAVRPRIAIVSAGAGNPYGHPAPSTLDRLEQLAGRTFRTDTDGSIQAAFDGGQVRIRTSGARSPGRARASVVTEAATSGPVDAALGAASAAMPSSIATPFLCGIPAGSAPLARDLGADKRPPVREAPRAAAVVLGPLGDKGEADRRGLPALGLLPPPEAGQTGTPGYHRPDGSIPDIGDRATPRKRSPRLLLGRRRVRARRRRRCVPRRCESLSGWPAGSLAPRGRPNRARPPPR